MILVFEPRPNTGIVTVGIAVKYGSMHEELDKMGVAHFMEHMMFKGTKKRTTKEISFAIEKKGGIINAYTSEQLTNFWCKVPSQHLKTALEVLSDIILNPKLDQKEMDKERKVILEEIKMYKDSPRMYVFDKILHCLYEGRIGNAIIGTEKTLNKIDKGVMRRIHAESYIPSNMILTVIGDADIGEVCRFAEEVFKKGEVKGESISKFSLINKTLIEERSGIDQANLVFAFHLPNNYKSIITGQLLNTILAGGMSSRLWTEIREKRNMAYVVKGGIVGYRAFAHGYIYVGTKKENVSDVEKIIVKEFKNLSKMNNKELGEGKTELIGNFKIGLEASESAMESVLDAERAGRLKEFYDFENQIKKITLKDVKEMARCIAEKYSLFALVPK